MTCHSCRHSAWSPDGLLCLLLSKPAEFRCEAFAYEPGTDERETDRRASMQRMQASLAGRQTDAAWVNAPDGTLPGDPHDRASLSGCSGGGAGMGRAMRARSNVVGRA